MRQSDRSGSFFSKLKTFIKAHPAQLFLALLFAVLSAATLAVCLPELIGRISYEGQEIGNWDTYLYYTVGHALKEGKIPYADMYENKPPMIFLLASLSYNFTGGYRLVNFFSAFAFLTKRYGAPAPKGSDAQWYHINWNYVFFGMWGPLCIISGVVHSVLWW